MAIVNVREARESGEWTLGPCPVVFENVSAAAFRIRTGVVRTSCRKAQNTSAFFGYDIHFKKEYRQVTGSFKERGARNALMLLTAEERKRGVIAASAGNHALGLAYHGKDLGVPITVIMPEVAPITKIQKCRALGANVVVQGAHIGESKDLAMEYVERDNLTYVNGYDHPNIIAGAGSIGLEVLDQVPDVEAVLVPLGGGGLIAGMSLAIKSMRPDVEGVEPERCSSFTDAIHAGKPVTCEVTGTLADGLAVPRVGDNAFDVARRYVDRVVKVSERSIALSVLRLVELEKSVIEGAGACGLAPIVAGLVPELKGRKLVIPLCGGNIDTTVLGRVIERGLAADGRLVRFVVTVDDRPGGIARLTKLMGDIGVSIKDVYHERAWLGQDVAKVDVKCIVETRGPEHAEMLRQSLVKAGLPLLWGPHSPQAVSSTTASFAQEELQRGMGAGPVIGAKL